MTDPQKHAVARAAAEMIRDGETIGLGAGSTISALVAALGQRVRDEGLRVAAAVASIQTEILCGEAGVTVVPLPNVAIERAFDSADEIDTKFDLLKGRGCAILRERLLAESAAHLIILADESKLVARLGQSAPLAVEVVPMARGFVARALRSLGATSVVVRTGSYGVVMTECGNLLLDSSFPCLASGLSGAIRVVPGVVECGYFEGVARELLIASAEGVRSFYRGEPEQLRAWADARPSHNSSRE